MSNNNVTGKRLLPKESSKYDRETNHIVRMRTKEALREHRYNAQKDEPSYIPANLGKNHPDWGMSMKDHIVEKELRNTLKSS